MAADTWHQAHDGAFVSAARLRMCVLREKSVRAIMASAVLCIQMDDEQPLNLGGLRCDKLATRTACVTAAKRSSSTKPAWRANPRRENPPTSKKPGDDSVPDADDRSFLRRARNTKGPQSVPTAASLCRPHDGRPYTEGSFDTAKRHNIRTKAHSTPPR